MKIRFKLKGITGLILSAGLTGIFALYVSARVGYLMLYAIVLAPVISFVMSLCFSKAISVKVDIASAILAKRDLSSYKIHITNHLILPTPAIYVELYDSPVVRCDVKKYIVSVMPMSKKTVDVNMYAKFCGPTYVGVSMVSFTDWLGMFTFEMRNLDYKGMRADFSVIPEINSISLNDENVMRIISISNHAEESDETVEASVNTFSGFPGYNSREYIPGDPLKRINWKQSAKRDKLLVRLDDEMSSSTISIILDSQIDIKDSDVAYINKLPEYNFYEEYEIQSAIAQETVENALGLAKLLINNNYTINFHAKHGSTFAEYRVEDEAELEYLRIQLANVLVSNKSAGVRFPAGMESNNVSVVVTAFDNPYMMDVLAQSIDISRVVTYSTLTSSKVQGGVENV